MCRRQQTGPGHGRVHGSRRRQVHVTDGSMTQTGPCHRRVHDADRSVSKLGPQLRDIRDTMSDLARVDESVTRGPSSDLVTGVRHICADSGCTFFSISFHSKLRCCSPVTGFVALVRITRILNTLHLLQYRMTCSEQNLFFRSS